MLQTDQSMHEYKLAKMKYSQIKIKQENSGKAMWKFSSVKNTLKNSILIKEKVWITSNLIDHPH